METNKVYEEIISKMDLCAPAPEEEPYRQYYFIGRARKALAEVEEKLGRKLTFHVATFGCQMNARDSEKLRGILEEIGYEPTDTEEADLVLYNTCTVRENANTKVYGRLGGLHSWKKKNPHMMIGLCGCMMQEEHVVKTLREKYRFVNLIFGTHNIYKLAELMSRALEHPQDMIVDIQQKTDLMVEQLPVDRTYKFKSGVNIMYGCNNFCSYCIVPYVRGREKSREPIDILREIEQLVEDGVIEVMLLGQNVNSYGKTLENKVSFAELLESVAGIEGLRRVRFMTSHPKDLSDDLIAVMAKYPDRICPHLHLPLQSGSSRLLKSMNRRYTKESYLELVDKIRAAMPEISLTTDIIVGYPGETEEDFLETMDVVEKVRYDSAFTFIYSKRSGTPAAEMDDQVPEDVVKDRFNRLLLLVQKIGREQTGRFEGQVKEVLVEHVNEQDPGLVTGRMDNNSVVHFPGDASLIGQIVKVKLDKCHGFYYLGTQA
uniref:tRNA (N6-isopentenyl adenosine(37)-C2)-methylthiotransferase MiaB n=1 Tax=Eubacterium cellulosolvens TaxID=29322 RepID=UPI00048078E9|nr:tRNA (N6-isopentenyl adenosine(37)-C2)-methylthiotransferase MiaB [[Eubacterium] cellulosolvens]